MTREAVDKKYQEQVSACSAPETATKHEAKDVHTSAEPPLSHAKSNFHNQPATSQQDYNLLKLVLDNIPQYVFWKDTQSVYLGCNSVFSDNSGLNDPADIKGLTDFDLSWKKKEADFFCLCDQRVMKLDRAEYNIVEPKTNIYGIEKWFRTSKIPLHDEQENVIGILGMGEDITDKIKSEERLRYYEIMTSTIDDMIAILDHDLHYLAVNDTFCATYKQTREQIIGLHIKDLTEGNVFENLLQLNIANVLAGKVTKFEGWRIFPKTEKRYIQYCYYPIFDNAGNSTSFVAQLIDITETKKLETQLHQAQKMEAIGQLTGGIAHDFNNILSVINGYSELALITMKNDDPNRTRIKEINTAGTRAARLTQQLLAFSKKQLIKPQPLNFANELKDISRMLKQLLGENITINIDTGKDLWLALMDHSQFEQVILNLSVNARDAISEDGTVNITISNLIIDADCKIGEYTVLAGDYVELLFSDTGHGMSTETLTKIFEPFFSTKPKETGTGLGLSTVYGIIKQNKGYISVTSERDNGTTFKLLFPRCSDNAKSKKSTFDNTLGDLPGGTETILLVEDDASLRAMCVSILKELGYTVLEAENGREAIDSANNYHGKIDLLLTDIVMPELGGAETAELLTRARHDLKVLFMSGYTEKSISHRSVLNKGINFIQKPVTPKTLSTAIRRALQLFR